MSEEAFAQIFKLLDHDEDHQISQKELTNYIKIFTKWIAR